MSSQFRCQQKPRVGGALGCFQCIPFLCSWNPVADLGALESSIPLKNGQIPCSCRIPKVYWRPKPLSGSTTIACSESDPHMCLDSIPFILVLAGPHTPPEDQRPHSAPQRSPCSKPLWEEGGSVSREGGPGRPMVTRAEAQPSSLQSSLPLQALSVQGPVVGPTARG